jgi:KRAB domain-containing zinc finger protein
MQVTVPENALTAWLQTQPAIAEDVAQMSSFQCTECDRTFPRLTSLCWHIRVHYLRVAKSVTQNAEIALTQALHDGPYQCTVCDRHFATESDLSMHIANNLDSHECADCGRRIESAFYLRVHQMAHRGSGGQPVVKRAHEPRTCPICGRTMKSASNLHGHMAALHAQTKKFICDVCARQFARRSQLTRHMLCHGGERRFECGKCGRRFLLRDMMRRHMRAVHARLRPHLCNLCGRPFAEKHQLNTHMKVHRA